MREWISDALAVIGAAVLSCGVGLIYLPSGLIVAGLCLVGFGILVSRNGGDDE